VLIARGPRMSKLRMRLTTGGRSTHALEQEWSFDHLWPKDGRNAVYDVSITLGKLRLSPQEATERPRAAPRRECAPEPSERVNVSDSPEEVVAS